MAREVEEETVARVLARIYAIQRIINRRERGRRIPRASRQDLDIALVGHDAGFNQYVMEGIGVVYGARELKSAELVVVDANDDGSCLQASLPSARLPLARAPQ